MKAANRSGAGFGAPDAEERRFAANAVTVAGRLTRFRGHPMAPEQHLAGTAPAGRAEILKDNIRQDDPNVRRALAHLRAGNVQKAVAWYADEGRIVTASTRHEALDAIVDAWATDLGAGRETAMYAWRRANVEELNSRARARMATAGRVSGPELTAPGGRRYAAGDRIVTLAPGADGRLVTSERGRVLAVDPGAGTFTARMDDGRIQPFAPEETIPDRLAPGYAVTVHRSQGATVDTAHRYEDGGGRELAYAAMSRARWSSHVYVVADNLDQAIEDLTRDWSAERRPRWAIDTGTPARALNTPPATPGPRSRPSRRCAWPACGRNEKRWPPPSHPIPARSSTASRRGWSTSTKPSSISEPDAAATPTLRRERPPRRSPGRNMVGGKPRPSLA